MWHLEFQTGLVQGETQKILDNCCKTQITSYMDMIYFFFPSKYEVLPKISESLNILCKPLALRTCAARCLFLYLSTNSLATGIFISARVSEFWLFLLNHFHECLRISKWRELRSKELALNFASSSTKLQLRPTEC